MLNDAASANTDNEYHFGASGEAKPDSQPSPNIEEAGRLRARILASINEPFDDVFVSESQLNEVYAFPKPLISLDSYREIPTSADSQ